MLALLVAFIPLQGTVPLYLKISLEWDQVRGLALLVEAVGN